MTAAAPVLHGDMVLLRPATGRDAKRLAEILSTDEVAQWWGEWDVERVHHDLLALTDATVALVIDAGDQTVGAITYLEETEPDYRHASLDIFLHPDWHGRGIGADAIRTLARHLVTEDGHHRLTIDPAAANEKAIRSYTRVGFRPVGLMRRYERGRDGTWHDGLLMDLLAEDLH